MTLDTLKTALAVLMRRPRSKAKPKQPTKAELEKRFRLVLK